MTTSTNSLFMRKSFTSDELNNSVIFDPDKRLRGDGGESVIAEVSDILAAGETRSRALKQTDAARRTLTLSVFMANLAAAAINRVAPDRFIAVSFSRNTYAGTGLSVATMTALRDVLLANDLIEGRLGVRREDTFNHGYVGSSLTRVRATPRLKAIFQDQALNYRSIERALDRSAFVLTDRAPGVSPSPPPDVAMTAEVIDALNHQLRDAAIALPADALERVIERYRGSTGAERKERGNVGDLTANSLFRSFKGDWMHGGRLYGGWWINLPKEERPHLTIDGEKTVELDYSQLHPSILFARAGIELDFDLYTLPGHATPELRNLGKDTFARLLNHKPKPGSPRTIALKSAGRKLLPNSISPETYIQQFTARLKPVERWLLVGEGLRLQRADSDLALGVLKRMTLEGTTTLPIHDSFIVQEKHREALYRAMVEAYKETWGYTPRIKG